MRLIITIDTEEDDWGSYRPTGATLGNIERIPALQELFDDYDVQPTYLLTYAVVADERAVSVLKAVYDQKKCDIGAHCHPWNTPPFEGENGDANAKRKSMLCNLPPDVQFNKIRYLHETIRKNFGMEPISFRSGRWGYSDEVARCLHKLGYKIDTSILPYTDWACEYGPNFSDLSPQPYRFFPENALRESINGPLLEVPATVGYFQRNFNRCNRLFKTLQHQNVAPFRLVGMLHQLGLLNKIWLSPETSSGKEMIKLARRIRKNNYPFINLFFHSTSLKAGLSCYVRTKEDEQRFLQRIREFLAFTREEGIESVKLSDVAGHR